jgi:mono/diheme cytochrome c family protein
VRYANPSTQKWLAVPVLGILLAAGIAYGVWSALDARRQTIESAKALTSGDPTNGELLLRRFGCGGCHTISGVPGADGKVGPSLEKLRERVFIAGRLRNSGANLVDWIFRPQEVDAHAAMPSTGITEPEARDVAAYLYAH